MHVHVYTCTTCTCICCGRLDAFGKSSCVIIYRATVAKSKLLTYYVINLYLVDNCSPDYLLIRNMHGNHSLQGVVIKSCSTYTSMFSKPSQLHVDNK